MVGLGLFIAVTVKNQQNNLNKQKGTVNIKVVAVPFFLKESK